MAKTPCEKCPLGAKKKDLFVPPDGDLDKARVIIIGEAPGREELRQGKPFVGPAGRKLLEWLRLADLTRDQCYITNAVKCFPGSEDPHKMVPYCREAYLEDELSKARRDARVLALGAVPAHSLCRKKRTLRGSKGEKALILRPTRYYGLPTVHIWHPAYILRSGDDFRESDCLDGVFWAAGKFEKPKEIREEIRVVDVEFERQWPHEISLIGQRGSRGRIVGHNLVADFTVLLSVPHWRDWIRPGIPLYDTMLAMRHIDENQSRYDLKTWASILFGYDLWWEEFEAWCEAGGRVGEYPKLKEYNEKDLLATRDLYAYLREYGETPAMRLDFSVVPIVAWMQHHGLGFDEEAWKVHEEEIDSKIEAVEGRIGKDWGVVNLRSPSQVKVLLWEAGVQVDDTREETLKDIDHPLVLLLREYRKLRKIKDSYLERLRGEWLCPDGCFHPRFNIYGTETGRWTVNAPPLQTIPEMIRDVFSPRLGEFVWVDLSQIEYRIMMDMAREERAIEAINQGADVHSETAKLLFGSSDGSFRKIAKTVNYLVGYGGSAKRLSLVTGISEKEAQGVIDRFFEVRPNVDRWIRKIHKRAQEKREVKTPSGRVRHFPTTPAELDHRHLREAVNFMIQSFSHDLVLLLLLWVCQNCPGFGKKYVPVAELHDELVFDCDPKHSSVLQKYIWKGLDKLPELCYSWFGWQLKVAVVGEVKSGSKWR